MKSQVYAACEQILTERVASIKAQLHELVEGAKNDSKSTAGDKHETSRAMMQIEQEKLSNQQTQVQAQLLVLKRIDPSIISETITTGSLVNTNQGWLYISVPLGRITVQEHYVMCLSSQSPLGVLLNGHRQGEKVNMNGVVYELEIVS